MKQNKSLQSFIYLSVDYFISLGSWMMFFILRRKVYEEVPEQIFDHKFYDQLGKAALIASFWILIYAAAGLYTQPFRKSRFRELGQIFQFSLFGVLLIFFTIFLDDERIKDPSFKYYLFYFGIQVSAVSFWHFLITSRTVKLIRKKKLSFPTLIIGNGKSAFNIWEELRTSKRSLGNQFSGYVPLTDKNKDNPFLGKLKRLGELSALREIITGRKIEEVIIAPENSDKESLMKIAESIEDLPVIIKIVPEMYDYLTGSVRTTQILGSPLMEIRPSIMEPWQEAVKRGIDIAVSSIVLLLLSPVYLVLAIAIKFNSPGPVLFRQERIGKFGKPFYIIKFRTMVMNAEKAGPSLSSDGDPRITKIGRFLRKTRLDETPNFINVLKGEMSLVGPRPERQFYIDQIVKIAPHYSHLQKVRPGITSWGQVKFGYAENVDEMVERLKFDILYIENMSLALDLKILMYTVVVMVEGRGK